MSNQDFVQLMDEIVVTPQPPTPPEHPVLFALRQLIAEQSLDNERMLRQIQEVFHREIEEAMTERVNSGDFLATGDAEAMIQSNFNEQLDSREFKRAVESISQDLLDSAVSDLEDKISDLEDEIDSKVSDAIDAYDFSDSIKKEVVEAMEDYAAENKTDYGSAEFFDCYLEKHVTKLIDDKINFMLAALAQQLTSMMK